MENENRQNTDWLKELADDASLWEERAYEEMPAVIAHEYKRLHELAEDGNVYGVMLQIKDVYEIILKYPCVLGLCIFRRTKGSAGAEAFDTLMSEILEKLLSFGDWRGTIAKSLIDLKEHLPAHLVRILEKTYALVNENFVGKETDGEKGIDVVNWRNDVIGHGALRLVEDDALKREICSMLKKLKEYFGTGSKISIHGQYDNIILMQSGNTLVGWQTADLKGDTSPFSLVIKNDEAFSSPLEDIKYILPYENKICFFDTYMRYKQKSKYLDYVAGHLNIKSRDFFYDLYTKLVQDEKIKTMQKASPGVTDTETEKLHADLDRAVHFQKPSYIYDWMETKLNEDSKGCYMLRMGRGMGKSALSAYLDGRYNNTKKTPIHGNFVIRTHHCSRNQIRGINDFVTSLNTMFLEADHLSGYTKDIEGIFKDIKRDEKRNRAAATAELLNSYAKYFRQRKGKDIVLVVDGLDEIVDYGIFEYFPASSSLEDGVYIFYTARPDEELSEELRGLIGGIDVLETRTVTGEDEDYKKLVRDYAKDAVKNELEQRGVKNNRPEAYRELVETAGFNFLKLRVLIPAYCSGNGIEGNALASEADMFAYYLRLLNEQYGEKFFTLYVKPLLVNLAIFCDGLALKELLNLMDNMDSSLMLYATLNDLRGVLSVARSGKGNIYRFANEEYLQYVQETAREEILQQKERYRETIAEVYEYLRNMSDEDGKNTEAERRRTVLQAFPEMCVLRSHLFHLDVGNDAGIEFLEMLMAIDNWIGFDVNVDEDLEYISVFQWMVEKIPQLDVQGQRAARLWHMLIKNRAYTRLGSLFDYMEAYNRYFLQLLAEDKINDFNDFFWLAFDMLSVREQNCPLDNWRDSSFEGYKWVFKDFVCRAWRKNEFGKVLAALTEERRDLSSKINAINIIFEPISHVYSMAIYRLRYGSYYDELYPLKKDISNEIELLRNEIDERSKKKKNAYRYELYNLLFNLHILLPSSFGRIKSIHERIVSLGYSPRFVYTNLSDRAERQIGGDDSRLFFGAVMDAVNKNDRRKYHKIIESVFGEDKFFHFNIWEKSVYQTIVDSPSEIMSDEIWEMINKSHPIYQMYRNSYEKAKVTLEKLFKNDTEGSQDSPNRNLRGRSMLPCFQFRYASALPSASFAEIMSFPRKRRKDPHEKPYLSTFIECAFLSLEPRFDFFPKKLSNMLDKIGKAFLKTILLFLIIIQTLIQKRECTFIDFKKRKLKINKFKHFVKFISISDEEEKEKPRNFFFDLPFGMLIKYAEWCQNMQFHNSHFDKMYDITHHFSDTFLYRIFFLAYINQPTTEQVRDFKSWLDLFKANKTAMTNEALQLYYDQFHMYFIHMVRLGQSEELFASLSKPDVDVLDKLHESTSNTNMRRYVIYMAWMAWFCFRQSDAENAKKYATMGMRFIKDKVFSNTENYDYRYYLDGWVACAQILLQLGRITEMSSVYEPFVAALSGLQRQKHDFRRDAYLLMMLFNWVLVADLFNDFQTISDILPKIKRISKEADEQWQTSRFSEISLKNIEVLDFVLDFMSGEKSSNDLSSKKEFIDLRSPVFPQFATQVMGINYNGGKTSVCSFFDSYFQYDSYCAKRYPCFFSHSDVIQLPSLVQTYEKEAFKFETEFRTLFLSPSDFMIESR